MRSIIANVAAAACCAVMLMLLLVRPTLVPVEPYGTALADLAASYEDLQNPVGRAAR